MNYKRVLHISGRTISLFTIKGRKLMDEQVYGHDENGLDAFSRDIKAQPTIRTWILADLTDEDFHIEQLPHVFGNDQRAMLDRKVKALLRETRFRHSEKQGREKEGRRDDSFLISGITNVEMLDPWIDRLLQEHTPIIGIYSVPLLATRLYELLKPTDKYVVIVSQGEMSGLRQTFFIDEKIKVSRLTPTRHLDTEDYLQQAIAETNRFWHFITSTRLAPVNQIGHAYILGNTEFIKLASRYHANSETMSFHFINIDKLIRKVHFTGILDTSHADEFLALLLSNSRQPDPYATPSDKRYYYHLLANRLLVAGATIAWLYVLFTLPLQITEGLINYNDLTSTMQQQQQMQRLYEKTIKTVPSSPASGSDMQNTVSFYQQVNKHPSSPMPYLKSIGQLLQQSRNLTINELNWAATTSPDTFPDKPKQEDEDELALDAGEGQIKLYPVLILSGTIDIQRGIRQAVRHIDTLKQQITDANGIHKVDVLTYPLEINPEKTLSGGNTSDTDEAIRRKFSLRIIWEPFS